MCLQLEDEGLQDENWGVLYIKIVSMTRVNALELPDQFLIVFQLE